MKVFKYLRLLMPWNTEEYLENLQKTEDKKVRIKQAMYEEKENAQRGSTHVEEDLRRVIRFS